MSDYDTWALPLVKQKLLNGERITQADMLKATGGKAWRLPAAIYHLSRNGWEIMRHQNPDRTVSYYLTRQEILWQRERLEKQRRAA